MSKPKKLKRTQERSFSAHHMLIRAAERAQEAATKNEPGELYDNLATMTFSALAIEALCNAIGERVIPDWTDFESTQPNAKLRILCDDLGLSYRKEDEPWATVRWLLKFRNQVAHAKPETVTEEKLITQAEHEQRLFDRPESKIEKQLTTGNAKRALDATKKVMDILVEPLEAEQRFGISVDGWSGSTQFHPDGDSTA